MVIRRQHYKPILATVIMLLLGSFVIISAANYHAINRQMHAWKLLPEPERLTELYFTDHTKLPNMYYPGTSQTVSFTVHNLEYRKTPYTYVITQTDQATGTKQQLATGSFTLNQGAYQKLAIPITLSDLGDRSAVGVTLTNTNQNINYLVKRG